MRSSLKRDDQFRVKYTSPEPIQAGGVVFVLRGLAQRVGFAGDISFVVVNQ